MDENIFVHYEQGSTTVMNGNDFNDDDADDIDYDAYYSSIEETFENLSGLSSSLEEVPVLGPDDQLFIYIVSVGSGDGNGNSFLWLPSDPEYLDDDELAGFVSGINCSQMIVFIEASYSGGFIDDLTDYVTYLSECINRSIHTSCNYDDTDVTYLEFHISSTHFSEFSFYWTAAARGAFPLIDEPWKESSSVTTFPFENYSTLINHPGPIDPDINGDGFVQMEEAFEYADNLDTWSGNNIPGNYYMPIPPYSYDVAPQINHDISFQEDLFTLAGLIGSISNTQMVYNRNYLIGGELNIEPGVNLTLEEGTGIYLGNETSKIIVQDGATLTTGDFVDFYGADNEIEINGIIQTGIENSFTGEENDRLQVILNYTYGEFDNLNFENSKLIAETAYWLNIEESNFINSFVEAGHGNIYVNACEFDNSSVKVSYTPFSSNSVQISGNTFTNYPYGTAITIESYPNFNINGNNISGYGYGIKIFNSGSANGTKLLQVNTLTENYYAGIMVYNTYATIKLNGITQNGYGVFCLNRSNVELLGVKDPEGYTQHIEDCIVNEVYATKGSFPHKFRYNSIVDYDGDCLVLYTGSEEGLDVRYNYWGSNFQPEYDLCPEGSYIWFPVWNPGDSGDETEAEIMYNSAKENIAQENYAAAKVEFQQIVLQYPSTNFAQASLKELFSLEKLVSDDYNDLKSYYNTEPVIQSNQDLNELAEYLSNFCEIKLENWPTAIAWFEDVIINPESLEDSIFAIIDLGYTYFLMENGGLKSTYAGNLSEHIPVSMELFEVKRDYLLSLLPGYQPNETLKESISTLKPGELLQNVPNPFKGSTQIWYKLNTESNVQLKVYNYTGQLISTINEGTKTKGTHHIDFDANGLKNGIYFYSISINGQTTDSKKMTIMK